MSDGLVADLAEQGEILSSSSSESDTPVDCKKQRFSQCVSKMRKIHKECLQKLNPRDFLPIIVDQQFVCSTTPLSLLRRITIREAACTPRINCKGGYILLRTLETPFEDESLNTIVEDDEGTGAIFSLYNVNVTPHRDIEDSWPVGTIFFLKEPYCLENQNGTYCLNCESPSDLVFVHDRPDLLELTKRIRWTFEVDDPLYRKGVPDSAKEWMALGSAFKTGGKTEIAMRCYNLALYTVDKFPEEHLDLRLNIYSKLCRFYYSKGFYEKALTFADKVMEVDNTEEDLYSFAVMCHYYLRNYGIARHLSQFGLKEFPDYRILDIPSLITEIRHLEMLRGNFDMHQMFLGQKTGQTPFHCPDYTGPIRKAAIEGKGRGVIATRKIRPGTLLVACKALAFSWKGRKIKWWEDLVALLSSMITKNPQKFGPIIYSLFDGINPVDEGSVKTFCSPDTEQEPILDIYKLQCIVKANAIGDTQDIHVYKSSLRKRRIHMPGCGVYDMPSYFNHSCIPNASLHEYNDLVFIRAIKSIEVGEEICIPYVSWDFPYSSRKQLLSFYGFECLCGFCQLENKLTTDEIFKRYEIYVDRNEIYNEITSVNAVFKMTIIENIDCMLDQLHDIDENIEDFSLKACMSTLYALRANAYAMTTCHEPNKKQEELTCHLMTLHCRGLDPETLLISLENGACLIPNDAILDEGVLFACNRLIYLYHALNQNSVVKDWIRVLIALEKIYSGEDINVLKLRYPHLCDLFDTLNV